MLSLIPGDIPEEDDAGRPLSVPNSPAPLRLRFEVAATVLFERKGSEIAVAMQSMLVDSSMDCARCRQYCPVALRVTRNVPVRKE